MTPREVGEKDGQDSMLGVWPWKDSVPLGVMSPLYLEGRCKILVSSLYLSGT